MSTDIPYIVAKGRKGGSNVAACNFAMRFYMRLPVTEETD
jgi:precorrin isomerase